MSLHLGNISPHIHRDDLERVFRRFGMCNVRVVDKYGFVVFDYPASAEKALKSLRGKRICGEAITLSWSKRQPRGWQGPGLPTGGKMYEPPVRRHLVNENVDQRLGSNNKEMDYEREDGQGRNLGSADLVNDSRGYHPDDLKSYVGEKDHALNHNLEVGVRMNHLEVESWREQVADENCFENVMEFDRYEPRESDDEKEQEECEHASPSDGSPAARKFKERPGTEQNGQSKSQKTCYTCGEVGHKMNVCPLNLLRSRSRGRLHQRSGIVPTRQQESNREPSTSRSHWRLLRRGDSFRRITSEFRSKKRNSREYENYEKRHSKKGRGLLPSSIPDHASSRPQSLSRSLRSFSRSPSNSKFKSVSSGNNTQFFSLRPSTSGHSGSKALKSRSASRSVSPASSELAVELVRDLSPSQNSSKTNTKDSIVKVAGHFHGKDLFEQGRNDRRRVASFNPEKITAVTENEHEAGPSKLQKEEMRKDFLERDGAICESASKGSGSLLESKVQKSEDDYTSVGNLSLRRIKDVKSSQTKDFMLEDVSAPGPCITSGTNAVGSVRISSQEIYMVLKHYGLQYPEKNENDMPVETYFGSARLWPWEIIYYRRVKKGSDQAENHAQRVAQVKEFGIAD
ncbi:uncharacterized protein [Henckelia pumila]|uniref:uncharacterized protein n=1 Tax=Henckelia pumila TaxID=405737 RepID=UPI003C6E629F